MIGKTLKMIKVNQLN